MFMLRGMGSRVKVAVARRDEPLGVVLRDAGRVLQQANDACWVNRVVRLSCSRGRIENALPQRVGMRLRLAEACRKQAPPRGRIEGADVGVGVPDSLSARFDGDLVYGLGGRDVLTSYGYNDTYLDGGDDNDQLLSNFDLVNAPIIAGGSGGAGQPTVILTQAGGLGNDSLRAPIYEDDASERETEVTTRLNLTGGDGIDNITATITSADWSYLLSSIWGGIGEILYGWMNILTVILSIPPWIRLFVLEKETIRSTSIQAAASSKSLTTCWEKLGTTPFLQRLLPAIGKAFTSPIALNNISGGIGDDTIQATAQGIEDYYWS